MRLNTKLGWAGLGWAGLGWAGLGLVLALPSQALGTTVEPLTVDQRVDRSEVVIEAIVAQKDRTKLSDGFPILHINLNISEQYLGGIDGENAILVLPDNITPEGILRRDDTPELAVGERVLLLAQQNPEGHLVMTGWTQGLFRAGTRGNVPITLDGEGRVVVDVSCDGRPTLAGRPGKAAEPADVGDKPEEETLPPPGSSLTDPDPASLAMSWMDFTARITGCISHSLNTGRQIPGAKP